MKKFTLILFIFFYTSIHGQITQIPDPNFEQALINLGIDSDGVVNGQVFTSDVDSVLLLNVNFNNISDLTGIEDFTALEDLDISFNELGFPPNSNILAFPDNPNLKHFWMIGGDDAFYGMVESIDLSQNLLLEEIYVPGNWPLRQLDLKTNATDVQNLFINISISPNDLQGGTETQSNNLFCIKVTDEAAATAGTGVYSTWTIVADNNPYYFSETCALNTDMFSKTELSIYPNPVSGILKFNLKGATLTNISIFDTLGRLIMQKDHPSEDEINLQDLKPGLYLIRFESSTGIQTKRFIKN